MIIVYFSKKVKYYIIYRHTRTYITEVTLIVMGVFMYQYYNSNPMKWLVTVDEPPFFLFVEAAPMFPLNGF